jgi:hypothetical protein
MLTTPPVKNVVDNCVDQYKNVNSVLDTPIFPTPTPAVTPTLDEVQRQEKELQERWDNRWYTQSKEHQEEGTKRAMLWPQLPQEWSDVLHAYYKLKQEDQLDKSVYAPSPHDSDKIKNTISTLERVKRSQNNTVERENIDKIINQLNMDLMYFRIKHGK